MIKRLSIARALIELKTLDKRIEKKINELNIVAVLIGNKLTGTQTKEEFSDDAKADYQSIVDLIARRRKLKSAIVESNAVTEVNISGERMTVAEAIERKNLIKLEGKLYHKIVENFNNVFNIIEQKNKTVNQRLDQILLATFSKESSKVKADEYDAVAKPFLEKNEASFLDPLGVKKVSEMLIDAIEEFEQNVDIILTESNARTEIEI